MVSRSMLLWLKEKMSARTSSKPASRLVTLSDNNSKLLLRACLKATCNPLCSMDRASKRSCLQALNEVACHLLPSQAWSSPVYQALGVNSRVDSPNKDVACLRANYHRTSDCQAKCRLCKAILHWRMVCTTNRPWLKCKRLPWAEVAVVVDRWL